jgi:hypothetical protein
MSIDELARYSKVLRMLRLVERGVLVRSPEGGRSTSYALAARGPQGSLAGGGGSLTTSQ